MREFTTNDLVNGRLVCDKNDLEYGPPAWLRAGKLQTATGYGSKLNTGYWVHYNGRRRRVYCCCYSNIGTTYIIVKGQKVIVA